MATDGDPPDADADRVASLGEEVVDVVQGSDFFETLVEGGSDAIVSIDENSRVVYANQAVERVFGYDPEELVGEPLTTIVPDPLVDRHHEAMASYLATGERSLDWNDVRLPGEHRDGHRIQLSITFEEHEFDGVRIFSGIMRDVTDRVERERELERKNEQLERFAGIVSHDIRDPLNSARAQLALAREHGDEEYLDELESIHDRMVEIVDDVLALTKQGDTVDDPEWVDLAGAAEAAWSTAGADDASLSVVDDVRVRAGPGALRTLLENLLGNAVRHADEDVSVRVGALPGNAGFYVADDGPGIPEDRRDAVFEYGETTEEDGTGLGLSIVRDLAAGHGWSVSVTASASGGARFEFRDVEVEPAGSGA